MTKKADKTHTLAYRKTKTRHPDRKSVSQSDWQTDKQNRLAYKYIHTLRYRRQAGGGDRPPDRNTIRQANRQTGKQSGLKG